MCGIEKMDQADRMPRPPIQFLASAQVGTARLISYKQSENFHGLTLPSPCNPSMLLNMTSIARGRIPAVSGEEPPCIV